MSKIWYVEVRATLFETLHRGFADEHVVRVGEARDNTFGLEAGETWHFKAPVFLDSLKFDRYDSCVVKPYAENAPYNSSPSRPLPTLTCAEIAPAYEMQGWIDHVTCGRDHIAYVYVGTRWVEKTKTHAEFESQEVLRLSHGFATVGYDVKIVWPK
jgi:hypothetical protein